MCALRCLFLFKPKGCAAIPERIAHRFGGVWFAVDEGICVGGDQGGDDDYTVIDMGWCTTADMGWCTTADPKNESHEGTSYLSGGYSEAGGKTPSIQLSCDTIVEQINRHNVQRTAATSTWHLEAVSKPGVPSQCAPSFSYLHLFVYLVII